MSVHDAVLIALPAGRGALDDAPWWRVTNGGIVQVGSGIADLHALPINPQAPPRRLVGLAPVASTILHRAAFPGLSQRQAEVAGRLLAGEQSLSGVDGLHTAIGEPDDDAMRTIVAVEAATMVAWIGAASAAGLDLASIVPAALLVAPSPDDDTLVRATLAGETILRARSIAFVADPVLVDNLVGDTTRIVDASAETVEAGLAAAVEAPAVELRSGPFARRPTRWWDRDFLRRAAVLVGAILVVSLLIGVARIGRTYAEIAGIDARARSHVARALAQPPPLDGATAQLDARLAALGGGPGRLASPLSALVAAIEPQANVTLDSVGWRGDGTLAATLGAPRNDDINPVLIAVQADGYVLSATPRAGSDGRALADITIRSSR